MSGEPRGAPPEPGGVRVAAVMADVERDVRSKLRRRLVQRGVAAYGDDQIFERVLATLEHAADDRRLDALLLPELLNGDVDWSLDTTLKLSTHRPALGPAILFVKRRILLPVHRWLFEYSQTNFRRQNRLNRILLACIEELAIENARLRRDLDALAARPR